MARKKAAKKKAAKVKDDRVNKSPRERFRSVTPARLDAALKRLRMLKRCAGVGYECTEGEAKQIVAVIQAEADAIEKAFFEVETAEVSGLVLDDDDNLEDPVEDDDDDEDVDDESTFEGDADEDDWDEDDEEEED